MEERVTTVTAAMVVTARVTAALCVTVVCNSCVPSC